MTDLQTTILDVLRRQPAGLAHFAATRHILMCLNDERSEHIPRFKRAQVLNALNALEKKGLVAADKRRKEYKWRAVRDTDEADRRARRDQHIRWLAHKVTKAVTFRTRSADPDAQLAADRKVAIAALETELATLRAIEEAA